MDGDKAMSDDDRVFLTAEQAIAMLPKTEFVHTFTNPGGMLVGADWKRDEIIDALNKAIPSGIELSGATATSMGHGLCFWEGPENYGHYVFIETMPIFEAQS
jgi:hypothetical protein